MVEAGSQNECIECGDVCPTENIVCDKCVHYFDIGLACLYCRKNPSNSAVCEPCREEARESGDEDLFGSRHIQMMLRNQVNLPGCIYCYETLGIRSDYCIHCDQFQPVEALVDKPTRITLKKILRGYLIFLGFAGAMTLLVLALSGLASLTNGEDKSPGVVTNVPQPTYPPNETSRPIPSPTFNVLCKDGWLSTSGGAQGACSHHGGLP